MLIAMTREVLSHVIPVNEQCDELTDQSFKPELLGPSREAFRFSKASRSEEDDEYVNAEDDDSKRRIIQGKMGLNIFIFFCFLRR